MAKFKKRDALAALDEERGRITTPQIDDPLHRPPRCIGPVNFFTMFRTNSSVALPLSSYLLCRRRPSCCIIVVDLLLALSSSSLLRRCQPSLVFLKRERESEERGELVENERERENHGVCLWERERESEGVMG